MNRVYMTGEQAAALADFADGAQVRVVEKARAKAEPGTTQDMFGPLIVTRLSDQVKVEMDEDGGIPEPPPPSREKPKG